VSLKDRTANRRPEDSELDMQLKRLAARFKRQKEKRVAIRTEPNFMVFAQTEQKLCSTEQKRQIEKFPCSFPC
jgi:hypothetical protein